MTDKEIKTSQKEIIIDGVNVAWCEFLNSETLCLKKGYYEDCKGENCYYKQLQRKEQECKKQSFELGNLGYKIKNQRKEINERLKQLEAKTQECEELKKEIHRLNSFTDMEKELWIITERQKEELTKLKNNLFIANSNHEAAKKECDEYMQALEKIEENIKNLHYTTCIFHRGATHALVDIVQEIKNKILDIINEVKDE